MLQPRVIPCLLLKNKGLVKTVYFKNPKYVGDPINAVKIFNDKEVDELIFLDITATIERRKPYFDLIKEIATECFMPFAYGGGINNVEDAKQILKLGAEKIIINSSATNFDFIKTASKIFGNQSVVVSIDVKKDVFGNYIIYTHSGTKKINNDLFDFIINMEHLGAGELFLNSIDRDGTMNGYDLNLIKSVVDTVDIPVIACGGAGKIKDFHDGAVIAGASAVAAGSIFVFHGPYRAVLINYPSSEEIKKYLEVKTL